MGKESRKILLYRKGCDKGVVLSDSLDQNDISKRIEELTDSLHDSDNGDVGVLEFSNDFVIFKPSSIDMVVITKPSLDNLDLFDNDEDEDAIVVKSPAKNEEESDEEEIDVISDEENEIKPIETKEDVETKKSLDALNEFTKNETDDLNLFVDNGDDNKNIKDDSEPLYSGIDG